MARGTNPRWQEEKEICARTSMDKIKLCGYLKKKRNKVGGWRRLWFVLHDRLLVSYSSKEEYDNKLVSFKDVLNLVPGTQVRPLDGVRFTIETTTQVIYTFHCDDPTAYREWISMLLESAGSSRNSARSFHLLSSRAAPLPNTHSKLPSVAEHESGMQKSQTLRKQIERMSISGSEKYRLLAITPCIEEYKRSEMVTTQTTEHHTLVQAGEEDSKVESNGEPVYAVVDLQNKYDRRKKRSVMMEDKRCSSYESISRFGDHREKSIESLVYEDGDVFCNGSVAGKTLMRSPSNLSREKEENIYEPINVHQTKTSKFEFRKYISRLKLNPFLSTTPKSNFLDLKLPSANGAMSRFSTLRCKLGKHRKSVQRRMRNLYSSGYEPSPLFQYHEETAPLPPDTLRPDKSSKSEDSIGEKREETENRSDEDTSSPQKLESLPAFRKAVSKMSLLNISSIRSAQL